MANAFFVRCDCRNRRFTGGKSRFLQEADGRKGIASAADELCGSAFDVAEGFASAEARRGLSSRHFHALEYCSFYIPFPDKHAEEICRSHQLHRAEGSREGTSSRFILPCGVQSRASGTSPHSIYTMISERTEAVNSRRRTTRTPSSRTRPKRMTVPSTVYSTTPY